MTDRDIEDERQEPDEGDFVTEDYIHFCGVGGLPKNQPVFTVPFRIKNGRSIPDHLDDPVRESWAKALKKHFEQTKWFPSVWWVSDHGNYCGLNLNDCAKNP